MKQLWIFYMSLFLFPMSTDEIVENDPLIIMNETFRAENMAIDEWEVTMKESITQNRANQLLKERQLESSQSIQQEGETFALTETEVANGIYLQIKLMMPNEKQAPAELIAVIKGNKYDLTVKNDYEIVKTFLNRHFFTQSARLFACIKLNDDAIIDKNDHFEKLSQIFHIEDTIIQKDSTNEQNNYQILYGHTHLFTESLQVNDHSMNVHLVKRNQEQQTAFFIGTPILLNEY